MDRIIIRRLHPRVEILYLLLADTASIIIIGRGQDQIPIPALHRALGHHARVKDDGSYLRQKLIHILPRAQRQFPAPDLMEAINKKLWAEPRLELIQGIMMMDSAGEPHPLQVNLQSLEVRTLAIALIIRVNGLQRPADGEVITSVLIEKDVPPHQGSLRKVVQQLFLPQRKRLESRYLVTKDLQIREFIHYILKVLIGLRRYRIRSRPRASRHSYSCHKRCDYFFHTFSLYIYNI